MNRRDDWLMRAARRADLGDLAIALLVSFGAGFVLALALTGTF